MKLDNTYETESQEFKSTLSELDKGILSLTAMLNKSGKGKVYFGVSDSGEVIGLDGTVGQETLRKLSARVYETVRPQIVPKIYFEYYEDKANGEIKVAEEVADSAASIIEIVDSIYDAKNFLPENARSNNVELKVGIRRAKGSTNIFSFPPILRRN